MQDFAGKVAVVTGGASGIGRSLVKELLAAGAKVVIADVEQRALDRVLEEFPLPAMSPAWSPTCAAPNPARRWRPGCTTCTAPAICCSTMPGWRRRRPIWETTANDWTWVHGVNVHGVMHGIRAFVPRMLAGGEEGHVINTSSGDGGVSPLPYQSVYASSKAAVSCLTECLAAQLQTENTKLGASIFYPSGGLLDTGIWTTDRNRPAELAREKPYAPVPTVQDFKVAAAAAGMDLPLQDLDELARYCLQGIRERRFIIMIGLEHAEATLLDRAARIGRAELPINLAEVPQL